MPTTTAPLRQATDLDAPLAQALLAWGLSLADTKHKIGLRISQWVNPAPALEAAVAAAALTQDELGHARSLFAMLRTFPHAPAELGAEADLKKRTAFYYPRLLDAPWQTWSEVIAVLALLDAALSIVFEATRESQFAPLRQRAAKILQEERFHRVFANSWFARLAADSPTRETLLAAVARVWPVALAWFGPDDDPAATLLHQAGILSRSPAELRDQWLSQAAALLEKNHCPLPAPEIDWGRWDQRRRDVQRL